MKFNTVLRGLPVLLVLAGCTDEPNPTPTPPTPVLQGVAVKCAPNPVNVGQDTQCTATASYQNGPPASEPTYTWKSDNEAVARVDAAGKVTTLAVGTVSISASAGEGTAARQGNDSLAITARPPTVHSTPITASETWRAANNPHQVKGALSVGSGATLTLEAGVEVRFEQDAELRVADGTLLAPGTQAAPITLVAEGASAPAGHWRGLVFAAAGSGSALDWVQLSGCGRSTGEGACVAVLNKAAPVLRDVTVRGSGSLGVKVVEDGSAFGAGSARLSVLASAGLAVRLGANEGETLPAASTFTGNAPNAVELVGNVSRTQKWPNPGVPYVFNGVTYVDGTETTTPILTVSAGTQLRFGAKAGLVLGYDEYAALVVEGTSEQPVLFTSNQDGPKTPGAWLGVHMQVEQNIPTTRISHATFEYAGGPFTGYGDPKTGNLNFYGTFNYDCSVVSCPVLTDVTLQKSSGDGLGLFAGAGLGAGSARLTVRDNGRYAISMDQNMAGTLPTTGNSFSGNTFNIVELNGFDRISRSQTWASPGIPYAINFETEVCIAGSPNTLTIAPGTQIQFGKGASLKVGYTSGCTGALVAKGTAAQPIQFVPDGKRDVEYGYWRGLHFWKADGSQLENVLIAYGGANGDTTQGVIGAGNLNVYREIGSFMTNSTLRGARSCAVSASDGTRTGTTKVTTNFLDPANNITLDANGLDIQCKN